MDSDGESFKRVGRPHSSPEKGESFKEAVYPAELEYLEKRWKEGSGSDASKGDSRTAQSPTPTVDNNLVGLAFSGGGLRSACFNLGVAQGLEKRGVLRHVDYLSAVGGGAYVASSLVAATRREGAFPFAGPRSESNLEQ
ncbi:MAG: hypothetical protein AAF657_13545, partial [Acidobacteriota bacterium]